MLFFLYYNALHGQSSGLVAPVVIPPSPEAASLGKYADFPSATYNGIPDIRIPIYDLPVSNINHSVYLSYNSHGFKVQEEASLVGLGWNLISTGVITRSVNNIDDFSSQGYFRHNPNTYSTTTGRDAAPDMFNFNINGRTGKFIINYKPTNPGGYEIILLNQAALKIEILSDTTWKITDEKGVAYNFHKKERTRKEISSPPSNTVVSNFISSWYLSSISSPQGDHIEFMYYENPAILKNRYESRSYSKVININNPCNPMEPFPPQENHITVVNSLTQQVVLEKITFQNGYLEFGVSGRTDLEYQGSNIPKRTTSLKIKTKQNEIVKEINFHQDYFNSGSGRAIHLSRRLKLERVEEKNGEKINNQYSLEYLSLNLPDKDSYAKDYWGFYNGAIGNITAFGNREPSPTHGMANLLKSIQLPTGGKISYTFEANDYNNFDATKMEENPPSSVYGGKIGPGCRVSKIEFSEENNRIRDSKIYSYSIPSGTGSSSSGKRMSGSRYNKEFQRFINNPGCPYGSVHQIQHRSSENYFSTGDGGPGYEIGYSMVSENSVSQNIQGKKEYYFINEPNVNSNFPGIPTFVSNKNGYVDKTIVYRMSRTSLIKIEETDHLPHIASTQTTVARVLLPDYESGSLIISTYSVPSSWIYNRETVRHLYDQNGIDHFSETTEFFYDNPTHKQRTRESKTSSDGTVLVSYYSYPSDYPAGESFIDQMKTNHLVDYPIEKVQILKRNNQNHIISGSITKYKLGGQGLKDSEYYLEAPAPVPLSSFKFTNKSIGILPPADNSSSFSIDPKYKVRILFDSYQNGKLAQYRINDDSRVSFLWDYNYQSPIAETKNALHSQLFHTSFETAEKGGWAYSGTLVASADSKTGRKYYNLGTGNITKSSTGASAANPFKLTFWVRRSSGTGSWTFMGKTENLTTTWQLVERIVTTGTVTISGSGIFIDELRLHPAAAQMITYTHDPLVGMTSSTDIRNSTTYYEYDLFGRLKNVKNEDGNILEHYEYEFSTGN